MLSGVYRGKLAQLGELPPQRGKHSAQNALPFRLSLFRKCHREIAHPHLAQAEVQQIDDLGETDGESARKGARQSTQNFDERPGRRVFEFPPHQVWGQPPSASLPERSRRVER